MRLKAKIIWNQWFTADQHFGHARIIELTGRPFTSVDEMDEAIIERWNAVVGPHDIVWVLGDVALGHIATSLPLVGRLKGSKRLVVGNHDRLFGRLSQAKWDRWEREYRTWFDEIGFHVHTMIGGRSVCMSHFPFEGDSHGEDRYKESRPVDSGQWLIHGHVHEKWRVKDRQINVGVDVWDFAPVSEDQLVEIMRDGEK